MPRRFNKRQRQAVSIVTDSEGEADHIVPWSKGGPTTVENCQMISAEANRKKPVLVCCTCCNGTGKVELTGIYLDTLKLLAGFCEVTGAELAKKIGAKPTAMNNRLAALKRKGLADTRTVGRKKLYWATQWASASTTAR